MKPKKTTVVMLCIIGLMLVINLIARLCKPAADFYIIHIFPLISGFWSRITGILPFSVGEWLIVAGIVLLLLMVPGYLLLLLVVKKEHHPNAAGIYGHVYGWMFTWLSVVVTLHFTVLRLLLPCRKPSGMCPTTTLKCSVLYRSLWNMPTRRHCLSAVTRTGIL